MKTGKKKKTKSVFKDYFWLFVGFGLMILALFFNMFFTIEISPRWQGVDGEVNVLSASAQRAADFEAQLFPKEGVELPVTWGDLGQKLIENGVIDKDEFEGLYAQRGGMGDYERNLVYGTDDDNLLITEENAGFLLNIFWALGLANKNPVLDNGPMVDERYGGAGNFASTGGWSLSSGDSMDYYSKYDFIVLTAEQQALVEKVSQNIFRPCCDNSTYFPDCNHGMAMLGFLELMASQGAAEEEMYAAALQLNAYWFPATYLTIGEYLEKIDKSWDDLSPKEILGFDYSSSSGFRKILSTVNPVQSKGGASCGV